MTTIEQADQSRPGIVDTSKLPVGAALRMKREQLGWMLPDVAAWLRIKLSYLEALESGQVGKLPGNTYALGFLRAYAGMLGLDAEDISRRFRHETKDINRKPELAFPAPVPERGVPAGAVLLLGAVLIAGAYVAWYEFTGHEQVQPHDVPPVPTAMLPGAPSKVPAASPQVATVMPGPNQVPSPLPPSAADDAPATQPPVSAEASRPAMAEPVPAAPPAAKTVPLPAPVPVAPPAAAPAVAPPPAAVTVPAGIPGQITLKALATSWVQVRQVGGKVLYDHVLQPGESWAVPADAGAVTLTTGNAGGLTLMADGTTTPVLGRNGAVRRNIPLDASSIRDGSIATDSVAPKVAKPVPASN
ncbi:helix-turn-helix domain-containing protein [Lichenicola cladoniae]|uniref:Helix-turn-helix domain-containing protein n=1 Tax=Lichenicola cladoniae TaxID=1484109 RepID=A0A6M8HN31_9PROT|nr:helix-turn-helix domain-containing protein [Lichenicola cladoniae]NPD67244.1 helix-turn-helix domain-containing protein [Acetobacteraceae bacterium]QKE89752.1 helix-turn-helix domain-containing protein [Lichenicola cladoniae]